MGDTDIYSHFEFTAVFHSTLCRIDFSVNTSNQSAVDDEEQTLSHNISCFV